MLQQDKVVFVEINAAIARSSARIRVRYNPLVFMQSCTKLIIRFRLDALANVNLSKVRSVRATTKPSTGRAQDSPTWAQQAGEEWTWNWVVGTGKEIL